jgi:hypothetical protein
MKNKISEKQLKANRENAKKGGVKTPKGKAVSKYNAMKHGILSNMISEQERSGVQKLLQNLIKELKPMTLIELLLIEIIVKHQIRINRVVQAEAQYIERNIDFGRSGLGEFNISELDTIYLRYERTLENRLYRALHELDRFQRISKENSLAAPISLDTKTESSKY